MSLSKRAIRRDSPRVRFSTEKLAGQLRESNPDIVFAVLMGSASSGTVESGSDLDVAVYLNRKPVADDFVEIVQVVEDAVPGADVDLGFLNDVEPVYRFEALKGALLFTRDEEKWLRFYSLTCREYEHWMGHYEKQRRYRLDARS